MKNSCTRIAALAAGIVAVVLSASAQTLRPELSGLSFLVGHWASNDGKVAETGGTSKGESTITIEAGGAALLRRDHTDLFDARGNSSGGFDQIMLIYPEDGTIHADYSDGRHVIHYTSAIVESGHSVIFASEPGAGPTFRLTYDLLSPTTMAVSFAMLAPGQTVFRPIATGTLRKLQ